MLKHTDTSEDDGDVVRRQRFTENRGWRGGEPSLR